jgi:hypothetical protein
MLWPHKRNASQIAGDVTSKSRESYPNDSRERHESTFQVSVLSSTSSSMELSAPHHKDQQSPYFSGNDVVAA